MDKAFDQLVESLDVIAAAIVAISPTDTNTLNKTHGWNQVGLTLLDVAGYATRFALDIRERGADEVDNEGAAALTNLAAQLDHFRSSSVPQFWGANGVQAIPAYIVTIEGMRERISHLMPKYALVNPRALPAQLLKRIARITAELDEVVVDRDTLTKQMRLITTAYETAESLPEDLASLKEATEKVEKLAGEALLDAGEISAQQKIAHQSVESMQAFSQEAEKLVAQCEEAYRVTTSKGLAGAFDQRATGLTRSMQLWVLALVITLIAAAYLGGQRVELLSKNLGENDPKWGIIWLNFALSLLSVGAPLWFAWVATKQIGQRFRLAEDYGYKASIAKAYEGYRREAAKLDPDFTLRLFSSSLTRLEEAPLRLLEETSHGSPLHELLNSRKVQDTIATVPALREKMLDLVSEAQRIVSPKAGKAQTPPAETP